MPAAEPMAAPRTLTPTPTLPEAHDHLVKVVRARQLLMSDRAFSRYLDLTHDLWTGVKAGRRKPALFLLSHLLEAFQDREMEDAVFIYMRALARARVQARAGKRGGRR